MTSSPLVFVIVVNYNGLKYLKACLSSLEQQTYPNCEIVVFDNASTDGSVQFIKEYFPNVVLMEHPDNLGFAEGNNLALQFALNQQADYVFLVNNDTEAERDLVEKLVSAAQGDRSIGVVSPVVFSLSSRHLIQEMGVAVDKFGYPLAINRSSEKDLCGFFVSGCAMLIKADLLRKIGFFDRTYFMFAEDLDYCWRARLAGYKVQVVPAAKIYHASGGSIEGGVIKGSSYKTSARRVFLRERNTVRTLIKNYGTSNMLKIVPVYVMMLFLESFFWSSIFKPDIALQILRAIFWNLKSFPDTLKQRAFVQSIRAVIDGEVTEKMVSGYCKIRVFRAIGMPSFAPS